MVGKRDGNTKATRGRKRQLAEARAQDTRRSQL